MNTQQIRDQLLEKRRQILSSTGGASDDIGCKDDSPRSEFSEQAIQVESLEALFQIDSKSRRELNQINSAINRINRDEYGYCVLCTRAISEQRLRAHPYTDKCQDCAESGE